MRKLYITFIALLLFLSCSRNQEKTNEEIYHEEFYSVLNELIQIRLPETAVIYIETTPVYKSRVGSFNLTGYSLSIPPPPPPPPPPGQIYYDKDFFQTQIEKKHFDSSEADFMYHSIDSSRILKIDSSRVEFPTISKLKFKEIFYKKDKTVSHETLKNLYGKNCFIMVSTPVFNSKYSKAILSVSYCCGPSQQEGFEFILEKKNEKWKLIEEIGTWGN
jgi:hypothetical protein